MSHLLTEIKQFNRNAAAVLEEADLRTDSDVQSLTHQDLCELFPGRTNFKLRRALFDMIHKQPPVELLLKELKGFIPRDSFRDALTNNGVLVDYLQILKDMKTQMNNVQSFLDAHIGLLEELSTNQPDQESANSSPRKLHSRQTDGCSREAEGSGTWPVDASGQKLIQPPKDSPKSWWGGGASIAIGPVELTIGQRAQGSGTSDASGQKWHENGPTTGGHLTESPKSWWGGGASTAVGPQGAQGTSDIGDQMKFPTGPTGGYPHGTQREPFTISSRRDCGKPRLLYKMIVGGKTFDTHLKLMEKVEKQVQNQVRLCEDQQDNEITFVFCPISSRIASDVEAAMTGVKDDKPVILVLMHHTREVRHMTSKRTWPDDAKVVLHVNVFYHETKKLLACAENDAAVTEISNTLLESFVQRSKDTGGNAQGVGAESGMTGRTQYGGDGNHKGADHTGTVHTGTVHRDTVHKGADHTGTVHTGTVHKGAHHTGTVHKGADDRVVDHSVPTYKVPASRWSWK